VLSIGDLQAHALTMFRDNAKLPSANRIRLMDGTDWVLMCLEEHKNFDYIVVSEHACSSFAFPTLALSVSCLL
jgi:hypothetical protein